MFMRKSSIKRSGLILLLMTVLALFGTQPALAAIPGVTGTAFSFTAGAAHALCADGKDILIWGFANAAGPVQYPGPTLLLNEGDTVTINLTNNLAEPVSMVFPGQDNVSALEAAAPTQAGLLTLEAMPGGTVAYTFTASNPGTYYYQSGTNMDKQIELGLFGAIIVYPTGGGFNDAHHAYNHEDSYYDREFLFLLSEMAVFIHDDIELGRPTDTTAFWPVYWFVNGRNAPDTMDMAGEMAPWFPNQPYNCMPLMHPGERVLMRFIGAGRDLHPFHPHGNHHRIIARNGRLLSSVPGAGADLSFEMFTNPVAPGTTSDAIFTWTGQRLGFDIYGTDYVHDCNDGNADDFDDDTFEYCPDHGKPLPVKIPPVFDLSYGEGYSGSPFLGGDGPLPPGLGNVNLNGGYFYMWHSHAEKEMTNFDIFPGGMMTMLVIEAPWVPITE